MVPLDLASDVYRTAKLRKPGIVDRSWSPWLIASAKAQASVLAQLGKVELAQKRLDHSVRVAMSLRG